jgi:homoserine kinase
MLVIKVPCSSANIGPGFDVLGLGLSIYLELQVSIDATSASKQHLNCEITYEGLGAEEVPLIADQNLITQTALYVLRCHGQHAFPQGTKVHIINPIPLGRGLGSSGAAVVAGVILGSEVGGYKLSKARILDYCLMIERHPDNVAAALYGGFVGTYLRELEPEAMARKEIPLSEVLPAPAGGIDTGLTPPEPPVGIGHYIKFRWTPEIKAIAVIPDFEVKTADARAALPETYPIADLTFNSQRVALLTTVLGQSPPNPVDVCEAMRDKIHQPYRMKLIPGLAEVLQQITPTSHDGLLGICLSGAGPTILALATKNFGEIATAIITILEQKKHEGKDVRCEWKLLQPAEDGATVTGKLN